MTVRSYTISIPKPANLQTGNRTITGLINQIAIFNPGPQQTNVGYEGWADLIGFATPPVLSNIQFNNTSPANFIAATSAPNGGATLTQLSNGNWRLVLKLINVSAATHPLQVQYLNPPDAPSGDILQSASTTYAVTTTAPTPGAQTAVLPTGLPTNIWVCWNPTNSIVLGTTPNVVATTIASNNQTFTAGVNITGPGVAETLWYSTDASAAGAVNTSGAVITVPTSLNNATVKTGATFQVQVGFNYNAQANKIFFSANSGTLNLVPLSQNTGATWGNNGQLLTLSLVHNTVAEHFFEIQDQTYTGNFITSAQETYNVGASGSTGPFTVPTPGAPIVLVSQGTWTAPAGSPWTPLGAGFSITTPTAQNAGAAFSVSGTITGYSTAPTLNYRDDAGTYAALPAGAQVTATTFQFTNPGLTAGSHTISIEDANNNSVAVTTGSFNVNAVTVPVITVALPSQPAPTDPFTLSGNLAGYASAPVLTYSDDGGAATALPAGATVTATTFTFLHPGLATGSHSTSISDGTQSGSGSYVVTAIPGGSSPDLTVVTPGGVGSILDGTGDRWTVTAAGQVAVNGVIDTTATDIQELAWVDAVIWYEDASGLWRSKTTPGGTWTPTAGTLTSPLTNEPTISVNVPSGVQPNATFAVTGTLTNYSAAPASLTYSDNGGSATAFPPGSTITKTGYSFTHPGLPAGSFRVSVSDGVVSGQANFSIVAPTWFSLPATANLNNVVTGLSPTTAYDFEVYAVNAVGQGPPTAILTISTASPTVVTPGAPTGVAAGTVGQTTVTLTWVAPTTGTTPFTYNTQISPHGANTWTNGPSVSSPTAQFIGLTSGTTYDFRVQAVNSSGSGVFSTVISVTTTSVSLPTVTWQPTGATSTITFSTNKLTATAGGTSGADTARQACVSTTSLSSGKAMFEVTLTTVTPDVGVGLCNASFAFTKALGIDQNGIGYYVSTGIAPISTTTVGSVIGLPYYGIGAPLNYSFNSVMTSAQQNPFVVASGGYIPRVNMVFISDFNNGWSGTNFNNNKYATTWANDIYMNGTASIFTANHNFPSGTKMIPMIAICPAATGKVTGSGKTATADGAHASPTYASIIAGTDDTNIRNLVTTWTNQGFKTLMFRLNWEDNYPTTPAGMESGHSRGNQAAGAYTPWDFYGAQDGDGNNSTKNQALYTATIKAWRHFANQLHIAANGVPGCKIWVGWGITAIGTCGTNPYLYYPDSDQSDGLGKQVDCVFPDCYSTRLDSPVTFHTWHGYDSQAPFTAYAGTSASATGFTCANPTNSNWDQSFGNEYYYFDYRGGTRPTWPLGKPSGTTRLDWSGGWGIYESMVFALQQGDAWALAEWAGAGADYEDDLSGCNKSQKMGTSFFSKPQINPVTGVAYGFQNAASYPELAPWLRSRIAWFQQKSLNGIRDGVVLTACQWQNQSAEFYRAMGQEFPELVANPFAGQATGTIVITPSPGPAQAVYFNNQVVLTPSGNLPTADVNGATLSFCVDIDNGLLWVTSPSMRSTYGSTAWNDSATANPALGIGGIPFTISGPLSICFDTGESGGVAVLNAGSSPFSITQPSNFPGWNGEQPVVIVPTAPTGVAAASQKVISAPTIPPQTLGVNVTFQVQFSGYVPSQGSNIQVSSAAGSQQYGASTTGLTWSADGTVMTYPFVSNLAGTRFFRVEDTSFTPPLESNLVNFPLSSTTGGGGNVPPPPVVYGATLSWTAPTTGSVPFTYALLQSPHGANNFVQVATTGGLSASAPGLTPGLTYDFQIIASNSGGSGPASTTVSYTVPGTSSLAIPGAPSGVQAGSVTSNTVVLSWQAPTTGGAAASYQVQYKLATGSSFTNFPSTTTNLSQTITGLTASSAYNLQVVAQNAAGNGPASSPAVNVTTSAVPVTTNTLVVAWSDGTYDVDIKPTSAGISSESFNGSGVTPPTLGSTLPHIAQTIAITPAGPLSFTVGSTAISLNAASNVGLVLSRLQLLVNGVVTAFATGTSVQGFGLQLVFPYAPAAAGTYNLQVKDTVVGGISNVVTVTATT